MPSPPCNPGVRHLVEAKRPWSCPLAKDEIERGFLGWHENGYLPHRDEPGLIQFVTFRLADAFPAELRSEWEGLLKIEDDRKRRIELEAYLDQGRGACHLRRADIAAMVEGSLLFRHDVQYHLRAWVIMPNHVHLLFLVQDVPMGDPFTFTFSSCAGGPGHGGISRHQPADCSACLPIRTICRTSCITRFWISSPRAAVAAGYPWQLPE